MLQKPLKKIFKCHTLFFICKKRLSFHTLLYRIETTVVPQTMIAEKRKKSGSCGRVVALGGS